MNRKSFFSKGFKLLKGQMIEQSVPQSVLNKIEEVPFRPLGVKNNEDFISKCTLCEECVTACPESVISMILEYDKIKRPQLINTSKCMECHEKNCITSCSDDALTETHISHIANIKFNEQNCIAHNGSMCRVCYDYCPEKNKAIQLERFLPVFDSTYCTACNKCSEVCVTGKDTIRIQPNYTTEKG